jgi:AraC family transcriptional regulator
MLVLYPVPNSMIVCSSEALVTHNPLTTSQMASVLLLERNCEFDRNHERHIRSVERVIHAMAARLDRPMSNEQLAAIACFSPCHFNRLFHRMTGIPPGQFHYALRIARAKDLLIDTEISITEICFDVGYNSLGTFVSRFRKLVGVSPSAFRYIARHIVGMRLADFPLPKTSDLSPPCHDGIVGTIECSSDALVIFVGLFNQPIPVGTAHTCTLLSGESEYVLPLPPDGLWHVLSVAVPRTAHGIRLLTLKDLPRGRSGPIVVEGGRWSGDSSIRFSEPSPLDPPMLAALPVQAARLYNASEFLLRPATKRYAELSPVV